MSSAATNWGSSGLAYLTGLPDAPPDFSRAAVLTRAEQVAASVGARLGVAVDAPTLLAGRAGLLGLTRRGRTAAGGGTRLLAARDGWCAVTLSRPDDLAAVPALLEADDITGDPWPVLQRWATTRLTSAITERAQLLDIPAAGLGEASATAPQARRIGVATGPRDFADLLVADLSSMWAGPLCGHLLARAGATVVKVESPRRPDGTRLGNAEFFDWMNGEKLSYCLDFDAQGDELRALLTVADIVIEGSRPAALARRRLGPQHVVPRPGRIWLRITGYGQQSLRPAFGDDAAVAGGLVGSSAQGPVFCGDAIADPLTGLEATAAVAESLLRGGGELIDVSMAGIAAVYAALPLAERGESGPVAVPQPPPPHRRAAASGADNDTVRRTVSERHLLPC
ncbi:CoA transferase [Mycobacterium sherrisii]|uniref:CoA transferase n=1 Tax=Mycobacterium sherrisii TaxID=243061 RepID=UPI000A15065E|nr:CoA transferase [Mycobacterium sherrisii]MCV7028110.1 CoA transferase [Mycobacterium sherrisii]ORW78764.1 acyl-CoA transferase [Mycobacterium sherrisii]